jgi:hypothetical protein
MVKSMDSCTLSAASLARGIGINEGLLVTRPKGRDFAAALNSALSDIPSGVIVYLDFSEVSVIDGSFADEALGTLALERAEADSAPRIVVLANVSEPNCENIEMALLTRPIHVQGLRNCVLPVKNHNNHVKLLGKAEDRVRETFELLISQGSLTARDLADSLRLSISASSSRLKTLSDLGLAARSETRDASGKQYIYYAIG